MQFLTMQKMIYKKNLVSQGEIVWMLNAFKDNDNKLKAIIMHDPDSANAWKDMPYEVVKLCKLRPTTADFNKVFEKQS